MVQEKVEMEEQQTSLEAELSMEEVQGDRSEEDRLTEAEKNERQRKMLQVISTVSAHYTCWGQILLDLISNPKVLLISKSFICKSEISAP